MDMCLIVGEEYTLHAEWDESDYRRPYSYQVVTYEGSNKVSAGRSILHFSRYTEEWGELIYSYPARSVEQHETDSGLCVLKDCDH